MHDLYNEGPAATEGMSVDASGKGELDELWPSFPYEAWKDTYDTLHMWTQIVGKIRLALSPMVNHWWQVPLYVTPRGLTTSPIPYGARTFDLTFDFINHYLVVQTSDGRTKYVALYPRAVADFYRELMAVLRSLGIEVTINTMPQEVSNPIALRNRHRSRLLRRRRTSNRLWRILVQTDSVLKEFRGRFMGKCSPVHFFWGSFDLAVTRFSGRRAPERPERRLRDARSLFARVQQRRFLARQRQLARAGVLRLHGSRASRPRRSANPPRYRISRS